MNFILHFMLPTQAAGAIVLDGTFLIAVGSLIICYYLYKNIQEYTNQQSEVISNNNDNVLSDNKVTTYETETLNFPANHNVKEDIQINNSEDIDEELMDELINNKKEIVLNYR